MKKPVQRPSPKQPTDVHQAVMREFRKAPAIILGNLVYKKLAGQGVDLSDEDAQAFAERILRGDSNAYVLDDGLDAHRDLTLTLTEEDVANLEEAIKQFAEKISDLISSLCSKSAADLLRYLKREWPSQFIYQSSMNADFRERLEDHWGSALHGLRMMRTICGEIGEEFHKKLVRSKSSRDRALRSVLILLHARSCQIVSELIVLLENGFADGAMARWRTLYEIGVVAAVIVDGGEQLAQKYLDHDAVESKLALDKYNECCAALGFRPLSKRERQYVDREFQAAITKYGVEFGRPFGWATSHLREKRVTFADLENAAKQSHMRTYYKMASYNIHADIKGLTHRLGVIGDEFVVLAGASNAGHAEPGQGAAIALTRITGLLFYRDISNFDTMVKLSMLNLLRDQIVSTFASAERALKRKHRDYVRGKGSKLRK